MRRAVVVCCLLLLAAPAALIAQQPVPEEKSQEQKPAEQKPDDRITTLEERVRALEAELQALKATCCATAAPVPSAPAPEAPAPPQAAQVPVSVPGAGGAQLLVYGGAGLAAKALNPDISVIGDFLGAAGRGRVRSAGLASPMGPVPSLELHESEVAFQAIIDPYARGDFFLSFGESGVNVEEGYLTFTALPGGFVARVGKMRAAFGKVNTIHNHTLEWTDRPMVTDNLVGGEDGINDAGLSVSRILSGPKGIFLEATGQVYRGDSSDLFVAARRKDISYVAHLRGYKDLSESSNLDLGFSYAHGHSAPGADQVVLGPDFHTSLYGMDATFRWKPLRRAIYHSFLARTELVWSQRDQLTLTLLPEIQHAFGFYTSGEYRLNRRWTVGGRYDRTGRARQANLTDSGFSALLTYWPSEFSQIRGQYRFARYAEGLDANELRFQFLFVMGAHGAHPF